MNTYNPIEPTVIDEELLRKSCYEQTHGDAAEIARKEGIDSFDVISLRLDYKNILKIDNLWAYENLTTLQLDNNIIEKIENLSCLSNLTWLDLSFNNITVIEGLDSLTKLTDLSLFNNRITKIDNMESLVNLTVFSIGNNQLSNLENLSYLRRFKELKILNCSGNPFCNLADYKSYALAHCRDLKYFDYRWINEAEVTTAKQKYLDELIALEEEEKVQAAKITEKKTLDEKNQRYQKAHLDRIDQLFSELFDLDIDFQKFYPLNKTRIDEIREVYKTKYDGIVEEMKLSLMKLQKSKEDEVSHFDSCLAIAKNDKDQTALNILREFRTFKKKQSRDSKESEVNSKSLRTTIDKVSNSLMGLEMQLVEQLEEVIKEFERNYNEISNVAKETGQGAFTHLREFENEYHEKVVEAIMSSFDKLTKAEIEEMDDSLRDLLGDKDAVVNALTTSHEFHMSKFDAQEEVLVSGIARDQDYQIQRIHQNELQRNRDRVIEIISFEEKCLHEIELIEEN